MATSPEGAAAAAGKAVTAADLAKLKDDMLNANKAQQEQFQRTIQETVAKLNTNAEDRAARAPAEPNAEAKGIEAEILALGMDDDQAKAILSLVNKVASRQAPNLKKEIVEEVNQTSEAKSKKNAMEVEVASKYPAILDKNSQLFKETEKVYADFSPAIKKTPEATAMAVKLAAQNLGIQPLSMSEMMAAQAQTHGNGDGGAPAKNGPITERQKGFAAMFKVDPKKFEAKLKEVHARQLK